MLFGVLFIVPSVHYLSHTEPSLRRTSVVEGCTNTVALYGIQRHYSYIHSISRERNPTSRSMCAWVKSRIYIRPRFRMNDVVAMGIWPRTHLKRSSSSSVKPMPFSFWHIFKISTCTFDLELTMAVWRNVKSALPASFWTASCSHWFSHMEIVRYQEYSRVKTAVVYISGAIAARRKRLWTTYKYHALTDFATGILFQTKQEIF